MLLCVRCVCMGVGVLCMWHRVYTALQRTAGHSEYQYTLDYSATEYQYVSYSTVQRGLVKSC